MRRGIGVRRGLKVMRTAAMKPLLVAAILAISVIPSTFASKPPVRDCPAKPTDLCDFYFETYENRIPVFDIRTLKPDSEVTQLPIKLFGWTDRTLTLNSGDGDFLKCGDDQGGNATKQFYLTKEKSKLLVRTYNKPHYASSYENKCIVLKVTSAEIAKYGADTININKGDGNTKFPESRRCIVFKTGPKNGCSSTYTNHPTTKAQPPVDPPNYKKADPPKKSNPPPKKPDTYAKPPIIVDPPRYAEPPTKKPDTYGKPPIIVDPPRYAEPPTTIADPHYVDEPDYVDPAGDYSDPPVTAHYDDPIPEYEEQVDEPYGEAPTYDTDGHDQDEYGETVEDGDDHTSEYSEPHDYETYGDDNHYGNHYGGGEGGESHYDGGRSGGYYQVSSPPPCQKHSPPRSPPPPCPAPPRPKKCSPPRSPPPPPPCSPPRSPPPPPPCTPPRSPPPPPPCSPHPPPPCPPKPCKSPPPKCPPCPIKCPVNPLELCDFYFEGSKKAIPTFPVKAGPVSKVLLFKSWDWYKSKPIKAEAKIPGSILGCYPNTAKPIKETTGTVFGFPKSDKLTITLPYKKLDVSNKCIILPLTDVQIPTDKEYTPYAPYSGPVKRRCVIFKTGA